jgi:uracil-DNA glycosylase
MARFLPDVKISSVHGRAMRVRGRLVVPMFHPAAALHQPSLRPSLVADFAALPELIAKADLMAGAGEGSKEEKIEPAQPDPKQLSLF